jgi:hypothetical protein
MNLDKRIEALEIKSNPKALATAKIAFINYDGTVKISGKDLEDDLTFPSEEALDQWEKENCPKGLPIIKVSYARTAGIPPKEL